jgi:molybdopterin-guanine dinucleotide biosynthesis protein A
MGVAKATLLVDGEPLVARASRCLRLVCAPVVEVGPGYSDLPTVDEDPPGRGPLAALVAGADAVGGEQGVLLLACDLPFVSEALLDRIVHWPGAGSVVPLDAEGFVQPVCTRYSAAAISEARRRLAEGERSLRAVLDGPDVTRLSDVDGRELVDVDTPDDARRWGIARPGSLEP